MLEDFGSTLLDAAALGSGERVLDVGCGNGATTLGAAALVGTDGEATGFDLSAPMLDVARRRVADRGVGNARFVRGDAQTEALGGPYDAAISRFGIMFFADSAAAFRNIRASLRPGGRVTFLCWRSLPENDWMLVPVSAILAHVPAPELPAPDSPGPFRFADEGSLDAVLRDAGFEGVASEAIDALPLVGGPGSLDDAVRFVSHSGIARRALGEADGDLRTRALDAVREAMAPYVTDEGVRMRGAVWLVRATA
jgi:SAM-dependent methyltransferase